MKTIKRLFPYKLPPRHETVERHKVEQLASATTRKANGDAMALVVDQQITIQGDALAFGFTGDGYLLRIDADPAVANQVEAALDAGRFYFTQASLYDPPVSQIRRDDAPRTTVSYRYPENDLPEEVSGKLSLCVAGEPVAREADGTLRFSSDRKSFEAVVPDSDAREVRAALQAENFSFLCTR